MSTETIQFPKPRLRDYGRQALAGMLVAVAIAGRFTRAHAKPTAAHFRDHAYSICGLACISAAAFTHSTFAGLLVAGLSFFAYEWKVSDDANSER